MNAIATKLRKKPENLRMLNLLVRRDVAEGLYQLAKEAKVLPEALVSQWVEGKLPPRGGREARRGGGRPEPEYVEVE
jgi:hypothetical protein